MSNRRMSKKNEDNVEDKSYIEGEGESEFSPSTFSFSAFS